MSDTFFAMKSLHKNARRPKLKTRNTLVFVFPLHAKIWNRDISIFRSGARQSSAFTVEKVSRPLKLPTLHRRRKGESRDHSIPSSFIARLDEIESTFGTYCSVARVIRTKPNNFSHQAEQKPYGFIVHSSKSRALF